MASTSAQSSENKRPIPSRPPPPNSSTVERNAFSNFKTGFNKAHYHVDKGLSFDESNKNIDAKEHYQKALKCIDDALAQEFENYHFSGEDKDTYSQMLQKLTKTRLQVEYRLRAIEASTESNANANLQDQTSAGAPPSYDEAISGGSAATFCADLTSVGDSLMNDHVDLVQPINADKIFEVEDGVQIFFITHEGYVSAPSYPSRMSVFRFQGDSNGNETNPPSFMQVNDWIYPLIPGMSPALKTTYGAYMFPDTASDVPGAAVGLMLPDAISRQNFEDLLQSLTVLEYQVPQTPEGATAPASQTAPQREPCPEYSQGQYPVAPSAPEVEKLSTEEKHQATSNTVANKVSQSILTASSWISWGLGVGAEKAGQLIRSGSSKLQEHLKPEDKASIISPNVMKGAMYARRATHVAVQVSSFLVHKLGDATASLGRHIAPQIRKQGEKMFPKICKSSHDGPSKMDGVLEVAASGLKGFGTVFMGLEASAKILGKCMANETIHIVNRKYGDAAGKLTEDTLYSVGNVAMTSFNADSLGIKAIAKRAAKDTGKAVLSDLQEKNATKDCPDNEHVDAAVNGEKSSLTKCAEI